MNKELAKSFEALTFLHISDPNLCSHLYALCFIAESLFDQGAHMEAKRCSQVCPHLSVFQIAKLFDSLDHSKDNSVDTDGRIRIGMNIPDRYYTKLNVNDWK